MNSVCFHPAAESEMNDAAAWYETQQHNLGRRFLTSVQDALNRIQVHPKLYPIVESDVRRCLARTFPFGVLFRITPGVVVIMAVMHLHRDPDYWKNRKFETDGPANPAKPGS
jgi:toxin ParE1/3/4